MVVIPQIPVKTFLSKSKIAGFDYVINPYIGCTHKCIYCYAEYMRKFSGHEEPWGEFLDVRCCSVPLRPLQLFHARVGLSSVTDPYNPYEREFQLTRNLLKQLKDCQAYVQILTKSALVIRDLDLLKTLPNSSVMFSFSSSDETFRELAEPGASPIKDKIDALKLLHEHGVRTGVMIAPFMPGLTDWKEIIAQTRDYTDYYYADSLNMRPAYQRRVLNFIEKNYPHVLPLYTDIYIHENTSYWENLAQAIKAYAAEEKLDISVLFPHPPKTVEM